MRGGGRRVVQVETWWPGCRVVRPSMTDRRGNRMAKLDRPSPSSPAFFATKSISRRHATVAGVTNAPPEQSGTPDDGLCEVCRRPIGSGPRSSADGAADASVGQELACAPPPEPAQASTDRDLAPDAAAPETWDRVEWGWTETSARGHGLLATAVRSMIPEGDGALLDVGCGAGALTD